MDWISKYHYCSKENSETWFSSCSENSKQVDHKQPLFPPSLFPGKHMLTQLVNNKTINYTYKVKEI